MCQMDKFVGNEMLTGVLHKGLKRLRSLARFKPYVQSQAISKDHCNKHSAKAQSTDSSSLQPLLGTLGEVWGVSPNSPGEKGVRLACFRLPTATQPP